MATSVLSARVLEGTWEELQQHAAEFSGHRLQVKILEDMAPVGKYTHEFWAEKLAAFDARSRDAKPMTDEEWTELRSQARRRPMAVEEQTNAQLEDLIVEALDSPVHVVTDQDWARMRQDLHDRIAQKRRTDEHAA
jgi:hypothetical protein